MGRKKDDGGGGIPEWMCTFGDMMSLLLCFFIMLYSMSIITDVKWVATVQSFKRKMGYSGFSKIESQNTKISASIASTSEMSRRTSAMTGLQAIHGKGDFPTVQSILPPPGDIVKGGLIRFQPGSAVLTDKAKNDLKTLHPVLQVSHNKIMVQGHSAPMEVSEGGEFEEDIDLARARAVNVMQHLITLGLREEFFEVSAAHSSTKPNNAILPLEDRSNPKLSGASAAVYLITRTSRPQLAPEEQSPSEPPPDAGDEPPPVTNGEP
jgi:chemotaxis protein MotB